MTSMVEHLAHKYASPMPKWLSQFDLSSGDSADILVKNLLSSRLLYYPGSGNDGSPLKLFNSASSVSCFLYVDYMLDRPSLLSELNNLGFKGYRTLARLDCDEVHLGIDVHAVNRSPEEMRAALMPLPPYAVLEILEKTNPAVMGADRLAILFLCQDAHAAYDALFCQPGSGPPPFAVVIQDHGFGGNWSHFGKDGALHTIAERRGVFPELILMGDNSIAWPGFVRVEGVEGVCVNNLQWRHLYERQPGP